MLTVYLVVSKFFISVILFNSHNSPMINIIILTLQIRRLRHGEVDNMPRITH